MSRRREVPKRTVIPDPRFGDRLVGKFINVLMSSGKKSTAEGIMYGAFDLVEQRLQEEPLRVFRRAIDNVRPRVEVKSRRVGGATYQVPIEVQMSRGTALAMRWIRAARAQPFGGRRNARQVGRRVHGRCERERRGGATT